MKNVLAINSCRTRGIHKHLPESDYTVTYVHTLRNPEYLNQHYTILKLIDQDPETRSFTGSEPNTRQLVHSKISKQDDILNFKDSPEHVNLDMYDIVTIELNSIKCARHDNEFYRSDENNPICFNDVGQPDISWDKLTSLEFTAFLNDIISMVPNAQIVWIGPLNIELTESQIKKITNNFQPGLLERRISNNKFKDRELLENWLRGNDLKHILYPSDLLNINNENYEPLRSEFDFAHISPSAWMTLVQSIATHIKTL